MSMMRFGHVVMSEKCVSLELYGVSAQLVV